MKAKAHTLKSRRRRASQLSEFAVGMGILLLCFFFPMVDLLSVAVSYGMAGVLNSNQTREASLVRAADAADAGGIICKGLPDQWLGGMGQFVKIVGYPGTSITYREGAGGDKIVRVATTMTTSPFLPIPFPIAKIPGLNGPLTFTIASESPMENPDYAGPIGVALGTAAGTGTPDTGTPDTGTDSGPYTGEIGDVPGKPPTWYWWGTYWGTVRDPHDRTRHLSR
ncbi:MAG: hypothetical protein KC777_08250 [Cyanobacteria bacterium HKST-UBA02]|nr:hypothetical protein [Cyanobacteria bacterium HKST-UBA02]